jgi:hypothetical protein
LAGGGPGDGEEGEDEAELAFGHLDEEWILGSSGGDGSFQGACEGIEGINTAEAFVHETNLCRS